MKSNNEKNDAIPKLREEFHNKHAGRIRGHYKNLEGRKVKKVLPFFTFLPSISRENYSSLSVETGRTSTF
jgi:hypothetical protein